MEMEQVRQKLVSVHNVVEFNVEVEEYMHVL